MRDALSAAAAIRRPVAPLHPPLRPCRGPEFAFVARAPMRAAVSARRSAAVALPASLGFPSSRNDLGRAQPAKRRIRASGFCHGRRAGSANNTWLSRGPAHKSLIVEKTAPTSLDQFAMSHVVFAMSSNFARTAVARFFSLPSSLKERKKESEEGQEISPTAMP